MGAHRPVALICVIAGSSKSAATPPAMGQRYVHSALSKCSGVIALSMQSLSPRATHLYIHMYIHVRARTHTGCNPQAMGRTRSLCSAQPSLTAASQARAAAPTTHRPSPHCLSRAPSPSLPLPPVSLTRVRTRSLSSSSRPVLHGRLVLPRRAICAAVSAHRSVTVGARAPRNSYILRTR